MTTSLSGNISETIKKIAPTVPSTTESTTESNISEKLTASSILEPSPISEEPLKEPLKEPHIIEMKFGDSSKNKEVMPNESNKKPIEEIDPKSLKYVYALLYERDLDPEDAKKFVEKYLKPLAETADVTYLKKEKQFLLGVLHQDAGKIQALVQAVIDNGKYIYINDGSDVIFRPGMKYNQINHQRIQLMNYRCYLDKNDVKKFKTLVRPIFLTKQYWITEDGKEFSQIMKDAFQRLDSKSSPTSFPISNATPNTKAVEYQVDHQMVRRWIDQRLIHAQYESLKFKRQDLKLEFEKKEDVDYDPQLLKAIKDIEGKIKEIRHIYGKRLKEIKRKQEFEEKKLKNILQNL